jgi:murein L,D-transpeptidase YcbB/YkuD
MYARTRHVLPLWLWVLLFLLTTAAFVMIMARPAARVAPAPAAETATVARLLATPAFIRAAVAGGDADAVLDFYAGRAFSPAWMQGGSARLVRDALMRSAEEGLDPTDYRVLRVAPPQQNAPAEEIATYDILLSESLFRYARDLSFGRSRARSVYRDMQLPMKAFDAAMAVEEALADSALPALLRLLPPPHPEYQRLRDALVSYRSIAEQGGWPVLPAGTAPDLAKDDPRRVLLIRRLMAEDDLAIAEGDLPAALTRFQHRNGLEPDGRLGPKTMAALNVTAGQRVAQILANMERWRWLPRELESRRIMVNAADASLELVDGGSTRLTSKVIVGAPHTPTPIFVASATALIANPAWNVPQSIAVNEILPKLRRDPAYLQKNDMVLLNGPAGDPEGLRVDWKAMRSFPYRIQQRPGPKNPLGVVKLEMASRFDVYLHDTPGKAAFDRAERTLSHGCIRVENIVSLAALALSDDAMTGLDELAGAIQTGKTQRLPLAAPLPVYVLYWTAVADADGAVHFRPDVYGRDRRLIESLNPPSPRTSVAFYSGSCETLAG